MVLLEMKMVIGNNKKQHRNIVLAISLMISIMSSIMFTSCADVISALVESDIQENVAKAQPPKSKSTNVKEIERLKKEGKCPSCRGMGKTPDGRYTCAECNGTGKYHENDSEKKAQ
jgi:hypothetical protein